MFIPNIDIPDNVYKELEGTYFCNDLMPLIIYPKDNGYMILFYGTQGSTDEDIFIEVPVFTALEKENTIIEQMGLFISNFDTERKKIYNEITEKVTTYNKFISDFSDFTPYEDNKSLMKFETYRVIDSRDTIMQNDIVISRALYIRIKIFLQNMIAGLTNPELVLMDKNLLKPDFVEVKKIKRNGITRLIQSPKFGITNFLFGGGPHYEHRLNFISEYNEDMAPVLTYNIFISLYDKDYMVNNTEIIYNKSQDCVYIVYRAMSKITNTYKNAVIFILTNEVYPKLGILNFNKESNDESEREDNSGNEE